MARDYALEHLHPVMREKVIEMTTAFANENLPFRMCEGFRSPEQQRYLYSKSRTRPGPRVTNADAWSSYHQYGVACDFVLYINGKWSWQDSGKYKKYWTRMHELANEHGLTPLSWEKPHLQLKNIKLSDLHQGIYPDGGDESWAENLRDAIKKWRHGSAPPMPDLIFDRPALPDEAIDDVPSPISSSSTTDSQTENKLLEVTARSGLRMRAGPGVNFDIVKTLAPKQLLHSLSVHGDWTQVDLEGDGLADGFCHSAFLKEAD